jgi:aspartyl-tRNA(Asn)/glutamyl-tRNA(Gln) amidotransferase subunit B
MYEAVIGLEVHAQLLTESKAFCGCAAGLAAQSVAKAKESEDDEPRVPEEDALGPNRAVCPVCLGLPGALPVFNARALELGVRAARALGCEVRARSRFARKNYFYADLPKGYQISQGDEPLAENGYLDLPDAGRRVRIERLHLEEDAGKSAHLGDHTLVDLNRAGTPLAEIVSAPDLRSPAEAAEYLRTVREILMAAEVTDGDMEKGNFRCDANVSLRPHGRAALGTRVELKNINSFRFVERALAYEIARQAALLDAGEAVARQTRGFDEASGTTFVMREKEEGADYRYFPDPDLPPLDATSWLAETSSFERPQDKRERYQEAWGLSRSVANALTSHPRVAALFEQVVEAAPHRDVASIAGNILANDLLGLASFDGLRARLPLDAAQLRELSEMLARREITGPESKALFTVLAFSPLSVREAYARLGLTRLTEDAVLAHVRAVLADSPTQLASLRAGKEALFGYFMGQVMKRAGKGADPETVRRLLRAEVGAS